MDENKTMKTVNVIIPEDKELLWDEEEQVYRLVDMLESEKNRIMEDFKKDIDALHDKYSPLLKGKFSIDAHIRFTAYCDGNRHKVQHWVENSSSFNIIPGENCWHD